MNLNKEKIEELKEEIKLHDRPILAKSVLEDIEGWISWDDIGLCLQNPGSTDTLFLNKTESIYEHVSHMRFIIDAEAERLKIDNGGNKINTTRFVDADELLKTQHTIIISDYEKVDFEVAILSDYLIQLFHLKMDGHGVWPATLNNYSGHAHLYCGLNGSNWYHPRCDGTNNFLFQIEGTQKLTVYHNRATALTNVELDPMDTEEERKEIYDKLEILDELVLEPGDMMYIPNRQFYYVEPLENTISINLPLMLTGPLTVAF